MTIGVYPQVIGLWPPHPYPAAALAVCRPVRAAILPLRPPLVELETLEVAPGLAL